MKDSEAFPRRNAVLYMKGLFLHKHDIYKRIESEFLTTMADVMSDFDWEVKVKCLEFWECAVEQELKLFMSHECIKQTVSLISKLLEKNIILQKAVVSVFSGLDDYDPSVCAAACELCLKMKKIILQTAIISKETKHEISLPEKDNLHKKIKLETSQSEEVVLKDESNTPDCMEVQVRRLLETDWEALLRPYTASTDDYHRDQMSLVQDILLHGENVDNEDNILDCY